MSDVILVVIMVAFFLLAIAVVRLLGRMIDRDADPVAFDDDGFNNHAFDDEGLDGFKDPR
jgi:hypothetical protein